jgi:hypothetical protein
VDPRKDDFLKLMMQSSIFFKISSGKSSETNLSASVQVNLREYVQINRGK